MHDGITALRAMLQQRLAARAGLRRGTALDNLSDQAVGYARTRWASSQSQAVLIELLFGTAQAKDVGLSDEGIAILAKVRDDVGQLRKRLAASPVPGRSSEALRAVGDDGEIDIDPRDPNAAVHAALTNSLIAEACGIVTEWTAQGTEQIVGDHVIALDPANFAAEVTVACKTSAFRRQGSTHPLSFRDIGKISTLNGGLAALADDRGAPRYSCTGINAEVAVIQATILQAGNSMAGAPGGSTALLGSGERRRDDRPPVELAQQQFGMNELEASGLTISAPVEDLVMPDPLKSAARETDLPCLFLEDLWIGYRLDIAPEGGRLQSVHRQRQRITFGGARSIRGESEDYWPREAPNGDIDQLSTEILRFNGLSAAQVIDYATFLGTYEAPPTVENAPFTLEIEGCSGITPLHFEQSYDVRLRNVFQGGISLSENDSDLPGAGTPFAQRFAYGRARSFRAGEVVMGEAGKGDDDNRMSVFLTDRARSRTILVAPAPVDPDIARYNRQFLADAGEADRDAGRAFVTDLPAYLAAEGPNAPYYCDPDVAAINIELWMRNGDPQSTERGYRFENGVYCEMVEPLHVGPVTARFGRTGEWREFRPVEIVIAAASDLRPRIKTEAGGRRVRISVPVAADIELVLTPIVSAETVRTSACFATSTSAVLLAGGAPLAAAGLPVVEHRIRVVHCTRTPVSAPVLVSEVNAAGSGAAPIAILKRETLTDRAELSGYVALDAASSGDLQMEGAWSEIDDDPVHARFLLKEGRTISRPRSVQFRDFVPPSPAVTVRALIEGGAVASALAGAEAMIGLQCAENRIFLGGSKPASATGDAETAPCVLALGSSRRARLKVGASAKSRYSALFAPDPKRSSSLASRPIDAEVPASMMLPAPVISHVMPLVRQVEGQDRGRRTRQRLYAFRIYVRRPWFLSGHGERLAIGCHAGNPPTGPRDTLNRIISQWGEDPVARARSEASRRLPRASDFRAAGAPELHPALYPPGSPEGEGALLRFDDVVRDPDAAGDTDARLSLASYALRWDDAQKLWFCDVELGNDFTGWIGLALYRHQPQAHEGMQLSRSPAWVYSLMLQGERVTWLRQNGILAVTIGPVFDRTVSFEAEERHYRGGVSPFAEDQGRPRLSFERHEVDGKIYFEGRFAAPGDGIEVIRRRLGHDISSFRLDTRGS